MSSPFLGRALGGSSSRIAELYVESRLGQLSSHANANRLPCRQSSIRHIHVELRWTVKTQETESAGASVASMRQMMEINRKLQKFSIANALK